jgi:hypothetical protein
MRGIQTDPLPRSFSDDPRSGLAGVLAHVDICEVKLKLFPQRIQVLGCCSDLAFGTKLYFPTGRAFALNRNRPDMLRDYERRLFHSSSFPQAQPTRCPYGFLSAPLTKVAASCLTVRPHKTKVVVEVVTTFSSFRFPELSQPI